MITRTDVVISRCIERKTTAPFLQLCCEWIRDGNDASRLEGIGMACRLTPEQVMEHIATAQRHFKLMPRVPPRPELPTGDTFDQRKIRHKILKAREDARRKEAEAIAGAFPFGAKTRQSVVDALVETWRDPERYGDTAAWKALVGVAAGKVPQGSPEPEKSILGGKSAQG